LIFVLLAAIATYFIYPFNTEVPQEKEDKHGGKNGRDITSVKAESVTLGDMPIYLRGLGTVTGLCTVTVKSRVDGELLRVHYKEGVMVKEGDLLAEIDPRIMQIQLMQAEGQLLHDEALLKNAELD
jgi:multidrug efflux system membrane fusion protein